ncbi:glycosyltransferase family 4 protein [Pseudomonadota bacterium]
MIRAIWRNWRSKNTESKDDRRVRQYTRAVEIDKPDVLVAANFLRLGGIKQHIEAIQHYSSLAVELVPSEGLMQHVTRNDIESRFSSALLGMKLPHLKAAHSHVFPWAIRFAEKWSSSGVRWVHTYHLLYSSEHSLQEMPPWQEEFNSAQLHTGRHADVCISVSKWQTELLIAKYGISVQYLPNGVDLKACAHASARRFHEKFEISGTFALFIGRDDPVKNPAEFAEVAAKMSDLQFVMVGRALNEEYLQNNFGVSSPRNLLFLPEIPHLDALDAIAACSVLVVTSKREGLPTLILEAMGQAKPIVAPREAGCSEALGGGDYGYLYELGDVEELKAQIIQAMTDTERPIRAYQRVTEHYDWRVIAPQLDQIYLGNC